jgi:hypothetical protein
MAFYRYSDPDFFDTITDDELRFVRYAGPFTGVPMDIAAIRAGESGDDNAAMVNVLRLPPGGVLPRHSHACHRFEMVVFGELHVPDGTVLRPGDVMISKPGEAYGPHAAGPEGVVTVEVNGIAAAPLTFTDDPDLAERYRDYRERWAADEGFRKELIAKGVPSSAPTNA